MSLRSPHTLLAGAALAVLAGAACKPVAGDRVVSAASSVVAPPSAVIEGASVNGEGKLVVTYRLLAGETPIAADAAAKLAPQFVVAALSKDPDSGIDAWKSLSLQGFGKLTSLPISGPGSATVLTNSKQPGWDLGGAVPGEDLGDGRFRYTFSKPLGPSYDPAETVRVGMFLAGTEGSEATNSTYDFVPAGGTPQQRETVLDANCRVCHGTLSAHGGFRVGTKMCVICHTYQNADPDTVDPAALAGATPQTNPNPLDLGRLVHRIHRGHNLPTLYQSSSTAPAPRLGPGVQPPAAFFPGRSGLTPIAGARFSIIGYQSMELVPGQVVTRNDNGAPSKNLAVGISFPRDLRDCDACHRDAPQRSVVDTVISRRVCTSCHSDIWFGTDPITDQAHMAHPGRPRADDTRCANCHVTGTDSNDVIISQAHVPPYKHPNFSPITIQILSVANLLPGQNPTVTFTVADRNGVVSPLNAPTPTTDATSPVPRKLSILEVTMSGSTESDYSTGNTPRVESVPLTTAADANGVYTYTFQTAVPATATGTWSVGVEAYRAVYFTKRYDGATNTFFWPYTGEGITESAVNPVVLVDTTVGTYPGGNPNPRREIVDVANCDKCHGQLRLHGTLRNNNTSYCPMCHAPDQTDWARRPKLAGAFPAGNVNLRTFVDGTNYGTVDGIEERSVHFKVLIHRIHTGARKGSAQLDVDPFVVYGYPGGSTSTNYFDVEFPNDLANCKLCHVGTSYQIEAIPADALPTTANETASIQHAGSPTATAAHTATERRIPPITASCIGCHGTATAMDHALGHVSDGVEACLSCHGKKASLSIEATHGLK